MDPMKAWLITVFLTCMVVAVHAAMYALSQQVYGSKFSPSASRSFPSEEMAALYDLYESTGGDDWSWKDYSSIIHHSTYVSGIPWNFSASANPCTDNWQGLNCSLNTSAAIYHITAISLLDHNLRGTIPESIGDLPMLTHLHLDLNHINGTLPASLARLDELVAITVAYNTLTGPFPQQLNNLQNLSKIDFDGNLLTGSIFERTPNLPSLSVLYLYDNKLDGTFPETLCQVTSMTDVDIANNFFTSSLPSCLSNLTQLQDLDLQYNLLSGALPEALSLLSRLQIIYLNNNLLSGTIPDSIGEKLNLQALELGSNRLTGSLPVSLSLLQNLTQLSLPGNLLSGAIPPALGGIKQLTTVSLSGNLLSGHIPTELSQLRQLSSFLIDGNHFSGTIDGVFNPSTQLFIATIQLSGNQFTGTIPEDAFRLPYISTFAAASNCFDGSIPRSVCNSSTLSTLILDGLHAASSCQHVLFSGLSNAYTLTATVSGGVPSCLLKMPALVTLHLSGNALTGPLPSNTTLTDRLTDLALAHNQLTGTIPHAIQRRIWYNLDLSYNKFTGTLSDDLATVDSNVTLVTQILGKTVTLSASSLALRNNRLSAFVPSTVVDAVNITILLGNAFNCKAGGSDLPAHDAGKATYQCGSTLFNAAFYLWLGCTAVVLVLSFAAYYWRDRLAMTMGSGVAAMRMKLTRWLDVIAEVDQKHLGEVCRLQHYKYVIQVSDAVCKVALLSTVFIVVLFLPMYASLSNHYGTHTYIYAYTVSAAFMSGKVPLALMLTLFLVFLATLLIIWRFQSMKLSALTQDNAPVRGMTSMDTITSAGEKSNATLTGPQRVAIYVAFFLINFAVVLGANIAYLYLVLYESSDYNTIAQIALSVFKLLWNNFGAARIIRWTQHKIASSVDNTTQDTRFFGIQLFVALFNYIAIPCLVVSAVNPNCFNDLLQGSTSIHSGFIYSSCAFFSNTDGCVFFRPVVATTSYNPPFTYSYECSSSLITYYAPSFIYMALIVTFVNPALRVMLLWTYHRRVPGSKLSSLLERIVPRILRDIDASSAQLASHAYHGMFAAEQLLVTLMTYLGVLLTFGLVFPPIAVAMLVSIYAVEYTSKIEVGRLLTNALDQNLPQYLDLVEMRCRGVGSLTKLPQAAGMLLTFSCFFYAPFLFDTLGDRVGAVKAAWVLILLCALPFVVRGGLLVRAMYTTTGRVLRQPQESTAVELRRTSVVGVPIAETTETGDTESGGTSAVETVNVIHA